MIKHLDRHKQIVFLGDHHGAWPHLLDILDSKKIQDCYLISVGDSGIGFTNKKNQDMLNERLNEEFKSRNIIFMAIRGNHDDPLYYQGSDRIILSNFEMIEDYSVFEHNGKTIQFIGGAISIDRTGRQPNISYWENEGLVFEKEKLHKADTLVTHTAPSWCFPQQFNEMVYGWAAEDDYLLKDLTEERSIMDEIFKVCKPTLHLYGHFHTSVTERINGCVHKLLDINEVYSSH
jgi:predicted phosphodiesterase